MALSEYFFNSNWKRNKDTALRSWSLLSAWLMRFLEVRRERHSSYLTLPGEATHACSCVQPLTWIFIVASPLDSGPPFHFSFFSTLSSTLVYLYIYDYFPLLRSLN